MAQSAAAAGICMSVTTALRWPARWRHLSVGGFAGGAGLFLVGAITLLAICAPLVAPYDPLAIRLDHQLAPPDAQHWFGTDQSGRDVLSRVIWGARPSLEVGILAVVIGLI